ALLEDDAPGASEAQALKTHLAACPACAAYASELKQQNATLRRALTSPADDVGFARVKRGLATRLAQDSARRIFWRRTAWAAGTPAALVVVVVLTWHFSAPNDTGPSVAAPTLPTLDRHGDIFTQVASLQTGVRNTQVLDELSQLQVALESSDDSEAK